MIGAVREAVLGAQAPEQKTGGCADRLGPEVGRGARRGGSVNRARSRGEAESLGAWGRGEPDRGGKRKCDRPRPEVGRGRAACGAWVRRRR
ncbi:hypothetical protein NCAST_33_01270 [Nocardia asteroides NBRC 15531]|uniref:Uncharacterized protein n=1 Tax=Nocardia asteroides NBRC 15531 TaxID=1110697 RepID=U5ENV4_NOCAS|nr:hypothetical protein [Nocardia asteroides NBRC 15531]GAD86749.1 hypothetical protein NCAST_33_01270 [Nocardia asteroides NBRC 15531]